MTVDISNDNVNILMTYFDIINFLHALKSGRPHSGTYRIDYESDEFIVIYSMTSYVIFLILKDEYDKFINFLESIVNICNDERSDWKIVNHKYNKYKAYNFSSQNDFDKILISITRV